MRHPALEPMLLGPKPIDNSRVVREVDLQARRELRSVFILVLALVAALALYAWPGVELRQAGLDIMQLNREREHLIEQNRKLRLERASLQQLDRVEAIARRELHLSEPTAQSVLVVEPARQLAPGSLLAKRQAGHTTEYPSLDAAPEGTRN